jgi:hypothetical protein
VKEKRLGPKKQSKLFYMMNIRELTLSKTLDGNFGSNYSVKMLLGDT